MFIRNGGVVVEMSRAILEILKMFVEKVKECLMAATHTPRMREFLTAGIGQVQPEGWIRPLLLYVKF